MNAIQLMRSALRLLHKEFSDLLGFFKEQRDMAAYSAFCRTQIKTVGATTTDDSELIASVDRCIFPDVKGGFHQ
jgi:hypothetical protein